MCRPPWIPPEAWVEYDLELESVAKKVDWTSVAFDARLSAAYPPPSPLPHSTSFAFIFLFNHPIPRGYGAQDDQGSQQIPLPPIYPTFNQILIEIH